MLLNNLLSTKVSKLVKPVNQKAARKNRLVLGVSGALLLLSGVVGCTQLPDKVKPVTQFELSRYLGQWHEIARLDHSFERDLMDVSATYSMREDGGVRVINQGVNQLTGQAKSAEGKAYFVETPDIGRLKVSFFGPFYGGYNITKLDENYQMALVIGPNLDYAWILARSTTPSASQCQAYFEAASALGIDRQKWIELRTCQ